MPAPNTNYDDLAATTIESRSGEIADNVSDNTALLNRIKKKGNMRMIDGGTKILQELSYAENSNFIRYSGLEALPVNEQEEFTAAEFAWKQAAVAVVMSGLDEIQNSGSEKIIDLLEARITNAERTMRNNISIDIYSTGTASSSKQIGGLQLLVSDTPTTGIVGGINRATSTNAFWRNVMQSAANISASTIQENMYSTWVQLVRGPDSIDLMVADNNFWTAYNRSLTSNQRFMNPELAELGFHQLMFQNAPVVLDGGVGGACPTNHMYFLNTDYLHFCTSTKRNFGSLGGRRFSVNQDGFVQLIAWAGNMTVSNSFLQGVMKS